MIGRMTDLDHPVMGEEMAVAGIAGRHHAVEHVDATAHPFHQVLRLAHAHQVAGLVFGNARTDMLQDPVHVLLGLAHRQPADGIAIETNVEQSRQGDVTQILIDAPLDDAEQGRITSYNVCYTKLLRA